MKSSVSTGPAGAANGQASAAPVAPQSGRPRRFVVALFVAAAAVIVAIAVGVVLHLQSPGGVQASGTIEATQSDVAPKVLGRLISLRVQDGDAVKKGQIVAVLEQVQPGFNLQQARAAVAAAGAQVRAAQAAYDLQLKTYGTDLTQAQSSVGIAGSRVGQAGENLGIQIPAAALAIDQARAQLIAAQANYDHASVNIARAKSLVATGDAPKQSLDDATNAYQGASAQLQAAKDALALALANQRNVEVRRLDVTSSRYQQRQSQAALQSVEAERQLVEQRHAQLLAARDQLAQARAALGIAQDQVQETKLVAPFDGFVISHNFEVGDLVQPAAAVLTIGDLSHPYVYVYVSETDMPRVKLGTKADVMLDGLPKKTFVGTVTEISNTAEFTPENVQTKEERVQYLVFRIKIQFTDTTGSLKPGLPADAVIQV